MKLLGRLFLIALFLNCLAIAQNNTNNSHNPTWWNKYQYLLNHPADANAGPTSSSLVGANVDVSNECGPQSETFVAANPNSSRALAGGSNEIFRLPMRGYFSTNNGSSWGGVDLPLPPAIGANGIDFGSDPSLAFDTLGNAYYSYIVVFFSNGNGINGTEMAVARSTNGGQTYPFVNFFDFATGQDHFNDKPMVTTDQNATSSFKDSVYVAWDAASGGSSAGGIRVASSRDHGATFTTTRADDPGGPGRSIGASPFVAPDGTVFVAWNDFAANTIAFNKSTDGGQTWGKQGVVSPKRALFDVGIPAEFSRRALVYPACDSDRSKGPFRGRLYCSWMDFNPDGITTNIFVSSSADGGQTWSPARTVTDGLPFNVDRFNQWLSVDPVTGSVNVSFYDTRNDTTGQRFMTDIYFTQSTDGGFSWRTPNTRVTDVSSNEHDCNGVFPCAGIDYGNQQGDYSGLVSFGGVSHPIWTDSRKNLAPATGCRGNLTMEEVFTATVK